MCCVEQLWEAWGEASADFSVADSNMEESLEETNLDVCTAQIGHRFDCLAATLEMPVRCVMPFLGPGFRLVARWNRLVETVKTRKKRGKTGGKRGKKWASTV